MSEIGVHGFNRFNMARCASLIYASYVKFIFQNKSSPNFSINYLMIPRPPFSINSIGFPISKKPYAKTFESDCM